MLDTVLDAFAEATGCDRTALGVLVGPVTPPAGLSAEQLVDRVAAAERAEDAFEAVQAHDLAAFGEVRLADDVAERVPEHLQGRTAALEVAAELRVATMTAQHRLFTAGRAVEDHPRLLALVGTGAVSMVGLRKVIGATDVLPAEQRRLVDAQLAADVARSRWTPGQLEKAAVRRCWPPTHTPPPSAPRPRGNTAEWRCATRSTRSPRCRPLRAEEALAVFTRLDRTARGMRRDGDPRSVQDLMADLIIESVLGVPMVVPDQTTATAAASTSTTAAGTTAGTTAGTGTGTGPGQPSGGANHAHADVGGGGVVAPPVWRSVDGREPWLWSDPPPVHEPDPDPDDPAWDRLCTDPPPHDPACGDGADRDSGAASGCPPGADPHDDARGDPTADPCGLTAHPAHAPPAAASAPPPPGARRLPMRVEVQVVISAATLLGLDDQPGMLRGYGAVPASVVRDIVDTAQATGNGAARATLRALFCDPTDGRLVAMGSTARCFTGPLRQFDIYRDQDCRLTGGPVVDLDHIKEHQHGGTTEAANGQSLGKLAHVLKDHPSVTVRALPPTEHGDGLDHLRVHAPDIEWKLPSGHRYRLAPPPALGHGSRPDQAPNDSTTRSGWTPTP